MIICLIAIIFLIIGYYSQIPHAIVEKIPVLKITKRDLDIAAYILLVFGIFSFISNIISFGGLAKFIEVGYGAQRHVIMKEASTFGSGLELMGISFILLMYTAFSNRRKVMFVINLILLLSILSVTLLIGHRRIIIYIILMAIIIFHYKVFHIKLKWLFLIGFLAYVFFSTYAHTRAIWAQVGIVKGFEATYNFIIEHPNFILPYIGGEFIPPSHALIELLSDNAPQYQYGSSYIVGFIRILPRMGRIWPTGLKTLATWRLDTYYPGLSDKGIGYAFATIAEGYVNFGHLGVVIHMFAYGVLAKSIYLYFKKNSKEIFPVLVYAAFYPLLLFEGIRAEFSQLLWLLSHTYLGPIVLILIFLKVISYAINKREN